MVIRIKVGDETYVVYKRRKGFHGKYGANAGKSEKERRSGTKARKVMIKNFVFFC